VRHANREMTFGTTYWPCRCTKYKEQFTVLCDVTLFMSDFQSNCGFAHKAKRRNIQEMSGE
jgi:hypothetical protein